MTTGDVYARYLVRLEEMKQEVPTSSGQPDRQHSQGGPVNVFARGQRGSASQSARYIVAYLEGLIQHFELIMTNRGFEAPVGEVYSAIESANGELELLRV